MVRPSVLLLLLLAGAAPALPRHPSAAETKAEFAGLCERLTGGDNDYFGTRIVDELEARLAAASPDSLSALLVRVRLGYELIRLGRHRRAVAELESAVAAAAANGLKSDGDLVVTARSYLAMAHLQIAEDENCVHLYGEASCRLPVREGGIHQLAEHTRKAGDLYRELLADRPDDVQWRWLLNLARMLSGDYPEGVPPELRLPAAALEPETPMARWLDIAPSLGVAAFDLGGGAVMDDFDGDGLLDLVSSTWDPCGPLKAFRNDGEGGFEDVGARWGLDAQTGALNIVQADYDGDGRLDLLVLRGAWLGEEGRIRNSLLRNDLAGESGRFVDVTAAAGLAYPALPTQTGAWADYDGDGDLDLYVGNEATQGSTNPYALLGDTGSAYPSQLFRNNGDGTFTDVARAAGVLNGRFAKGVAWGDYDDDGDPDLFVSNIGANRLYRNDGDGVFTDVAPELGLDVPAAGTFAAWFFDYDNDGDLDIFNARYETPVPRVTEHYLGRPIDEGFPLLYRNDGDGFTEVGAAAGLGRPVLAMGANHGDLDNDGWPDVYLGTGVPDFDALMPNVMFANRGGRFQEVTLAGGFGHLQKGHGIAFGDLDNDGEQELFQQMGGAYPFDAFGNALYDNPGSENAWIVLRLEGAGANRFALGARVRVRVRDGEAVREVHALVGGGSFGGSSLQQEIGLGTADSIETVAIAWPGLAGWQEFRNIEPRRFYRAVQGSDRLEPLEVRRIELSRGPPRALHHPTRGPTP